MMRDCLSFQVVPPEFGALGVNGCGHAGKGGKSRDRCTIDRGGLPKSVMVFWFIPRIMVAERSLGVQTAQGPLPLGGGCYYPTNGGENAQLR